MFIYSVSCKVLEAYARSWENYFLEVHLQEVLDTGCFTAYHFRKDTTVIDGKILFVAEYDCPSKSLLEKYKREFGPKLKDAVKHKFPDQFTVERKVFQRLK